MSHFGLTVVILRFFGLLHSRDTQLVQMGPLVFGKRVCRKTKPRRTFGAAPKLSRTERFQDQVVAMENSGHPWSPFNGNHRRQKPKEPQQTRPKETGVPDLETHLSVDESSSSSSSTSSSSSVSPRSPVLEPLTTAPSGRTGGGPLPAGSSTFVRVPQHEETQCRPGPTPASLKVIGGRVGS